MYEVISQGDRDFSALITKMKSANIDLVYYGGYHTEAGLLVRQAREQGLTATLMSGSALVDRQFWAITGPTGEGTLITFAPDARKQPAAAEAVREFEAQGYAPEGFTLYTYAAVRVFAEAAGARARPSSSGWSRRSTAAPTTPCSGRSPSTTRAT